MKDLKKIIALVLVVIMALGVGSMAFADEPLPDLVLDGGDAEPGAATSPMIGTYTPPTSRGQATDAYKYQGWASLLESVPDKTIADGNYRYLVMTYTGDITQLRFEFTRMGTAGDGSDDEKEGPYWFNPEGQAFHFVTADGSPIPLVGNNTTIVIDLAESANPSALGGSGKGVGLDWYNDGIHMHCDEMVIHGNGAGYTISNAYLTTTLPTQQETTEASSEATSTEAASTEAPSTAAATTEAATTAESTTEAGSKLEAIILDGGEEGKSKLIKKFKNTNPIVYDGDILINDGYKHLGYVTFKDAANENYRYLALTYTGDITNLRLQFVHDAGGSNEEMGQVIWFEPTQAYHFVTADGSEIPLVATEPTTIFIDLEESAYPDAPDGSGKGVGMDWYNSGMHVHVSGVTEIDFTYAALLTELPKEDETLPIKDTVEGTTAAAGTGSNTPVTGDVSPVVISLAVCLVSLVVLGGAVVVRRRY